MAKPGKKYDVFINYNSLDELAVDVLVARLETQGIICFRDKWETVPGRGAVLQLVEGIKASGVFIVFVGRHATGPWQAREIVTALEERMRGHYIIPVFFPELPQKERKNLVDFLQSPTSVSFHDHLDESPPFRQLLGAIKGELSKKEPDRRFPENADDAPRRRDLKNPYKGLEAFHEEDHVDFFGRRRTTKEIIDDIEKVVSTRESVRLFVLTGVSGCGKSSLARAGVMAELSEKWGKKSRYATVGSPGKDPLYELATLISDEETFEAELLKDKRALDRQISHIVLSERARKFVLLIDQFEEVFTLCQDTERRRAFIDNLLFAASKDNGKAIIILTLRNEFWKSFIDAVDEEACNDKAHFCRRSNIPVVAMSKGELREAIVEPAHRMGVGYDSRLLDALLDEAGTMLEDDGTREGILPLLQVALMELWQYRSPNCIGYDAFKKTGGIRGALEKRANDIYDGFDEPAQRIAQHVFLNLVRINPSAAETRQRAGVDDLAPSGYDRREVVEVIRELVDKRLLVSDGDVVEIIHEALIRRWGVLRDWVESSRNRMKHKQGIEDAADLWQSGYGSLLTEKALDAALAWVADEGLSSVPLGLSVKAKGFLEASKRQEEKNGRSGPIEVVGGLTSADDSDSLSPAASIRVVEAVQESLPAEDESPLLLGKLQTYPHIDIYPHGHTGYIKCLAFSPDGNLLASGGDDKKIILWDVKRRQALTTLSGKDNSITYLSFASDGSSLVSNDGKSVIVWDVTQQGALATSLENTNLVRLSLSPDGSLLASARWHYHTSDKKFDVVLWDVKQQRILTTLCGHNEPVDHLSFNPDGNLLVSVDNDKTIILWDVEQQAPVIRNRYDGGDCCLSFGPDGSLLAAAVDGRTIVLWDVTQPQVPATLRGHDEDIRELLFSPDGSLLASAGMLGTIILWDVKQRRALVALRENHGTVRRLLFSPDGSLLASAYEDKTVTLWDVKQQRALTTVCGHNKHIRTLLFSPDGSLLASESGGADLTLPGDRIILLDVKQRWAPVTLHGGVPFGVPSFFSPDGNLLASIVGKKILLWDVSHESLRAYASRAADHDTPSEEWLADMGDPPYQKTFEDSPRPLGTL